MIRTDSSRVCIHESTRHVTETLIAARPFIVSACEDCGTFIWKGLSRPDTSEEATDDP
jgi:hypothetical protein